jgi:hypothetical protein
MGMYTEIFVSTRVMTGSPAVPVLSYMCEKGDLPNELPNHAFFYSARWKWLLRSSSYYFVPRSIQLFEYDKIGNYWVLIALSSLKNYNGEVEKFFDWLDPLLDLVNGEMIGYSRYEEDNSPIIWYKGASSITKL